MIGKQVMYDWKKTIANMHSNDNGVAAAIQILVKEGKRDVIGK